MSGRLTTREVAGWADELAAVGELIGPRFARAEPRRRAVGYVRGLLSQTERKNGWQLAEHLGDPTPDGVQHLLARAEWDADAVRNDLMRYVAEHLGHPDGVRVVDETGFLKKGAKSCGVARQYSGTAGRIENCQVGVFLGYATARGRALIDRALYLPKEWANDVDRRAEAGVPEAVEFATKIVLARRMVERAAAAGVPARWVTADAVYGSDYHFRATAEALGLGYVAGVRADFAVWSGFRQVRAKALLTEVPDDCWHRLSCGAGAKGPRGYDWALLRTNSPEPGAYARWVLIRRSVTDPEDVAYFACGGPPSTTLEDLVRVAGTRWAIEICQADCPSRRRWVCAWRIGYHRRDGVARAGRVVPATSGRPHRRSRMSDTTRRPTPPRA
jgi:SRSO17 transposase